MPQREPPQKVVILGAGAAGLSAAWHLAEEGVHVEILEADDCVGGLSKTVRHGEWSFDLGGHRVHSEDVDLLDRLRDLLGDELLVRERTSRILLAGKYFSYPLDARDLLLKLSIFTSARCMFDYIWQRVVRWVSRPADHSLEGWIVSRFGRTLYRIYFQPYSQKLWGVDPRTISSDWAVQRITLLSLWDVLLRLLKVRRDVPRTYVQRFLYPRRGIGQIWGQVADIVRERGGTIRLGARVKQVHVADGRIDKIVYTANGEARSAEGDVYVNTLPLPRSVEMFDPSPPADVLATAGAMRFRSLRFMNLTIDREQVSENTWIYVPVPDILFFRIQEPKHWSPANAPAGKTSLILEIACNEGDEIWNAPDEEIFRRCCRDLKRMGFDVEEDVLDCFSTFAAHGYPVYDLEYRKRLREVYRFASQHENLVCCGRQGLFCYNNMDHSVKMGLLAAEALLGRRPMGDVLTIGAEETLFEYDNVLQETREAAEQAQPCCPEP